MDAATILTIIQLIAILQNAKSSKDVPKKVRIAGLKKVIEGSNEDIEAIDAALQDSNILDGIFETVSNLLGGILSKK